MIRVAFDIHTIGQRATGNETYTGGLLQAFQAEAHSDVELYFYHSRHFDNPNKWKGHFRRLWPHWPYVRIPLVTPLALARDKIDVAHFQYISPPISPCPTVLTVHDLSFERHPEFFSAAMSTRLRTLIPFLAKKAAHILTVSEATKTDLIECYGLSPDRITVTYNGTPQGFHVIENSNLLQKLTKRFGFERPFALCVGNIGTRKNQQRLVRVFSRLIQEKSIEHDLVLVGKQTHQADQVLLEIERSGMKGRIHVTGFVTQEELIALYNMASFSVYPSLYEGFGLPVLESMACGTPVITSSVSSMPEIAGDAGLLINPNDDDALYDAISQLLENKELNTQLKKAGLKQCEKFSWSDTARHTLDVYRQIAG